MPKAYISCDMEGCSGIVNNDFCNPEGKLYKEAKEYMTGDLNAAIRGLQNAGVGKILVNDSHWNMTNIRVEDLPEDVELISGSTKIDSMVEGIGSTFDAMLCVGYHPRWGTEKGVIAHTYSGSIMEVRLNGEPVGETGIMGCVAGYYGVPVIFVSGDSALRKEVNSLNSEIHFTITKEGITKASARLYHVERVHKAIAAEVEKAWNNRNNITPIKCKEPTEVRVRFKETQMADMCMRMPDVQRVDNLTVSYKHDDYLTVFRAFLALQTIGGSAKGSG